MRNHRCGGFSSTYFYKADLTTGTINAVTNDVSFSTLQLATNTAGRLTVFGVSNDGKYIVIQGEQTVGSTPKFNHAMVSTDYGASFVNGSRISRSPFYWTHNDSNKSSIVIKTWGGCFSADNKYIAMASSNGYIYVRNLESSEINTNNTTYFGQNTTLLLHNDISGILFSDGTRMTSYNDNI